MIIHKCFFNILQSGGEFVFININKINPYRVWIEYLANWELIECSAADIHSIVKGAGIPENSIRHETDQTGMALVFTLSKS